MRGPKICVQTLRLQNDWHVLNAARMPMWLECSDPDGDLEMIL